MQLTMDILEGAEVALGFEQSTAMRSGYVSDIPTQARSDPFALARAILESGGPFLGSAHPYVGGMYLKQIAAKPAAGTNDAILQFRYEGPGQGSGSGGAAILVVDDDCSLTTEIETIDLNGKAIQAIFKVPTTTTVAGYTSGGTKEVPKTVEVSVLRPRRTLNVSGLLFGRKSPSAWARDAVGYVNDSPWPTGSLWSEDLPDPAGHWLCTHVSASVDRYKYQVFSDKLRPYRVRASFQSKIFRSWLSFGVFRNLYGNVPKEMANDAATVKEILSGKYSTEQNHDANCFVAVGLYKQSPFNRVFGF